MTSVTLLKAKLSIYTGWPKKKSQNLCHYNGAYTSWGEISFGTFVDVCSITYL